MRTLEATDLQSVVGIIRPYVKEFFDMLDRLPIYGSWLKTLILSLQTYHVVMTLCVMSVFLLWYNVYLRRVYASDVYQIKVKLN